MMMHGISSFDSDVASVSASHFGVDPTVLFSSLAVPDASSVADLLKTIPEVTYAPGGGVTLPDPASELGELCCDFLSGRCDDAFCTLVHPHHLLLAGAVCSLMTRYCQPKAQPQSSADWAGDKITQSNQENIQRLYALFKNNRKVIHPEPSTTDEEDFLRHCSKGWVQQLCDGPRPGGYMYFEAADIYGIDPSFTPFHELAEDVVNKYNLEQKENLKVKKVLKANWITTFVYMTMEAWDNKTKRDRTLKTGVWVKGNHNLVVGFVKDVSDSSVSN